MKITIIQTGPDEWRWEIITSRKGCYAGYCNSELDAKIISENIIREKIDKFYNISKICETCDKLYKPKRFEQRFCSNYCKTHRRESIPIKKCEYCGDDFKPNNGKQRFCSPSCAGHVTVKGGDRVCEHCGGNFTPNHGKQRFCGPDCRQGRSVSIPRPCGHCRKVFMPSIRARRFCSPICRAIDTVARG